MNKKIKVALIGLDTSHSVEFPRRMQGSGHPERESITGLLAVSCLRFATPFQNEEGLDARQHQLEEWGVKVTRCFEEAVAECDAIMIEINDPSRHLEYFERCAELGKPIFLDKPLADNIRNGRQIAALAVEKGIKLFSSSPLRYDSAVVAAAGQMVTPQTAVIWGPLGTAPAGSSLVWYGVHVFEMLQRVMGPGATAVQVINNDSGLTAHVDYADGRHGVAEFTVGAYRYGGVLRDHRNPEVFFRTEGDYYGEILKKVAAFFQTGKEPLAIHDTLEVMGMLDAADRAIRSGRNETVYR